MLKRQTEGSVICASCGVLVGVNDETCYNCGRRNPGLWGYAPALRRLGQDLGLRAARDGRHGTLYVLSLLLSGPASRGSCRPAPRCCSCSAPAARCRCSRYGRWWTVLTAGWLHAGVLHVLFNVMWIRQLAPAVADLYGAGPDGDHLHRGRRGRLRRQLAAGIYLPAMPIIGGAMFSVGASAPSSGCSAPSSTTAGEPATATPARPGCSTRCSSASSG